MIMWKDLFDELNIEWRDRGKNCSRNNVNISCPFCGDDPSFHLAVSETKDAYYCYRNPEQHSGKSLSRLLVALGLDYTDVVTALNKYNSDVVPRDPPKKPQSNIQASWGRFVSAAESATCTKYLRSRGFSAPQATCRQYDLRCAGAGRWAQRLLLPIRSEGQVISWTGRSVLPDLEPRYLTADTDLRKLVYLPRSVRSTLLVVEGPLDALKIAVATEALPVSSVALLGKGYYNKLDALAELAKDCREIEVALDADVSITVAFDFIHELSARVSCPVNRLVLPAGEDDPGGMELEAIREWVKDLQLSES